MQIIEAIKHYTDGRSIKPEQYQVLDVGCGEDALAFALASLGYNIAGIDVYKGTIEEAEKKKELVHFDKAQFICQSTVEYLSNNPVK